VLCERLLRVVLAIRTSLHRHHDATLIHPRI
jgi:hypothetical protein